MDIDTKPITDLEQDIIKARKYIERHFAAYVDEDTTPSHLFAKKTWLVTYPDVDRVIVRPMLFGEPFEEYLSAEYRLVWIGDGLFWKGGPFLRPDIVAMLEVV